MASRLKDARWQLAFDMAARLEWVWETLEYETHKMLLTCAQVALENGDEEMIETLARRFDS